MSPPPRILVLEDDRHLAEVVADTVRALGAQPLVCHDGHEAWAQLCTAGPFAALLSDVLVPGLSGLELVERARASVPGLPILLMSATSDRAELSRQARRVGADSALAKPFAPAQLSRWLERAVPGLRSAAGASWEPVRPSWVSDLPPAAVARPPAAAEVEPADRQRRWEQARALLRSGRHDEAVRFMGAAPRGALEQLTRAWSAWRAEGAPRPDHSPAVATLDRLLVTWPDFGPALYLRGVCEWVHGNEAPARGYFERAAVGPRGYPPARRALELLGRTEW